MSLLISLFVLILIVALMVGALRYFQAPSYCEFMMIGVGLLVALFMLIRWLRVQGMVTW